MTGLGAALFLAGAGVIQTLIGVIWLANSGRLAEWIPNRDTTKQFEQGGHWEYADPVPMPGAVKTLLWCGAAFSLPLVARLFIIATL